MFNPSLSGLEGRSCSACQPLREWCTRQHHALYCLTRYRGHTSVAPYLEHTSYLRRRVLNYLGAPPVGRDALHAPTASCRIVGVHHALHNAIKQCDPSLHKSLCAMTVLSGGNTAFSGLPERLAKEMRVLMPGSKVKVVSRNVDMSVWAGGSILACLPTCQSQWIMQEEYDEFGPAIVHRKCAWRGIY